MANDFVAIRGLLFFGGSDISFAVWVVRYSSVLISGVGSRLLRWNIVVLCILIIAHLFSLLL